MTACARRLLGVVLCVGATAGQMEAALADVDFTGAPEGIRDDFVVDESELRGATIIVVGGASGEAPSATLDRLRTRLDRADPRSTIVVFTGNYSSEGEMPGRSHGKRAKVERDVRQHLAAVRDFVTRGGQVFFLSGHEDYAGRGRKGVRRLRKFINRELNAAVADDDQHVDAMPHADCGEPTVVELGEFGVLVLVNSQWWMQDWLAHARANEGCVFKSRGQLTSAVELLLRKHRDKRVVVAMHHPIRSLGEYGGHFKAVEHFKPPVAGSLAVWSKQGGLVQQYRNHVKYDSLASALFESAERSGSFVFVSGHDRSLQVVRPGEQVQVVSGSSGKNATPVVKAKDEEFAQQTPGWAELALNASHRDRVTLVDGDTGDTLLQAALPPIPKVGESTIDPPPPITETTATHSYAKEEPRKSRRFKRLLLGDHYREAHRLELEFPVLDLSTERGGLVPVRVGGGNQTNSLRLEDPSGGQWALRSTTKDSSRLLPYPLNETFFVNLLVEDSYTATHPSAAEAIPPMAEAVGVFHTRPRLMYLPDQVGLDDLRGYISDEVVLLERRPKQPNEGNLPDHLGGALESTKPLKYVSTADMIHKIEDKPWKHRVDQEAMLRARLFDLFLGDWDRHEDQWRFVKATEEDGTKRYYPIPRDRDQAFSNYDGALLWFARRSAPGVRVLQPFRDEINRLTWLTYNARFIDPVLLNGIPRDRWMEIAQEVQHALTDEVIAEGMAQWPEDAYELDGEELERKLRERRDGIVDAAAVFYQQLNENVEIVGSEHADLIDITFANGDEVSVAMRRRKEGREGKPYYERTFHADVTDEIRIYALGGDDQIVVHGEPHRAITVRVVGGAGDDVIMASDVGPKGTAPSGVSASEPLSAKAVKIYDRKKSIEIDPSVVVKEKLSKSTYRNHYDRLDHHHEPSTIAGSPGFLINPDDGLYIGGTFVIKRTKFKRRPFASSHAVRAFFATATLGVDLGYQGVFPETAGPLDQEIELVGRTPNSTRNFFGFTDRFTSTSPQGRDFFRVKQSGGELRYGFVKRLSNDTVRIGLKGTADLIDTKDTPGRFVSISPDVDPNSLGVKLYGGAVAYATVDTVDSAGYPTRGIAMGVSVKSRSDVTPSDADRIGTSGTFAAAVATHIPFDRHNRFILSSRARVEGIVGDFPFYFAPTLGDQDIRAYNAEQLAGDGVFAQTSDLRVEVVRIKKGLPGAIGIAGAIDHGLAFGPEIDGRGTYHGSVGGILFWSILGQMGLTVGYHYGFQGGRRLVISFGALFGYSGISE